MNVATILAGGEGTRFGGNLPKQYVEVLGKPVLAHTLEVFQASPEIDAIQIICQPAYENRVTAIARASGIDKLRWITPGGDSCPASIRNGVYALENELQDEDIQLLHMGISPLVTPTDIAATIARAREKGCCFTMYPVNVCMAQKSSPDWADRDAPKEQFIELNSPWVFRYGELIHLYRAFEASGQSLSPADYTLNLWLASGRRAWYVPGLPQGRLKITTQHDMDMFEAFVRLQRMRLET